MDGGMFRDFDYHPREPDVRVFENPPAGVMRVDSDAFNCDIATPMERGPYATYAVDLDIDVLVRRDGTTYCVGDEDTFEESVRLGRFSPAEADGAREGLADLAALTARGDLLPFLTDVYAFGPTQAPPAAALKRVPLQQVPQVQPGKRASWTARSSSR